MKIIFILITLITINLYANESWIAIKPITDMQTPKAKKPENTLDINLSQIEPISKMMQNINLIQQIIQATSKKKIKKQTQNAKNWFIINH